MATIALGTILEANGPVSRDFWLKNDGTDTVKLLQGYTSCGCTTITFPADSTILPGDSSMVRLTFNPRGKGGEFYEVGTVIYGNAPERLQLVLEGTCITSEETLLKQFPVKIDDSLRLSKDRFDIGIVKNGEKKSRHVTLLHRDQGDRKERFTVDLTVPDSLQPGVHHLTRNIKTIHRDKPMAIPITFDLLIR